MTKVELAQQIKDDIKKKGYAVVPVGIFRDLFAGSEVRPFMPPQTVLNFAKVNNWDLKVDREVTAARVTFSPLDDDSTPAS